VNKTMLTMTKARAHFWFLSFLLTVLPPQSFTSHPGAAMQAGPRV
jgi:hypothetical protein